MLTSATRVILLIGAITFALCLVIITLYNVSDKEIIMPLVTGIITFFGGFASGYFQGRKAEGQIDLSPKPQDDTQGVSK